MADRDQLYTALRNADAAGDTAAAHQLAAYIQSLPSEQAAAPGKLATFGAGVGKGVGSTALGLQKYVGKGLRALGADSAGNWLVNDAEQGRAKLENELAPYKAENPLTAGAGELTGEIAATLPVGAGLGAGVKAASALPKLGALAPLATAIGTGGFSAGGAGMGTRIAGGAITGGASAGLVNDESGLGAVIGGALPPGLKVAGKAATLAAGAARRAALPQVGRSARTVLDAAEAGTPEEIAALRAGLTQAGPSMIPGSLPTVPMIVQKPGVAQLQRTVENVGAKALPAREAANNTARIAALDRISPVTGTVQQAAENMGNMTQNFARSAEKDASERVTRLYDAIDPANEGRILLPLDDMQAAKDTFLGRGTFGSGASVDQALNTARGIGTETIAEVKPMSAKGMQDLVFAVRAAGGINTVSKSGKDLAGEIRNLKESGLKNIVRPNQGISVERMAEKMHESGFLPDNDPASLLEYLHRSAGGDKIYASSADDAYRAAMEAAQGTPPPGGTFAVPVPYNELQNLRSSIGEAANKAEMKGSNRENGALSKMIGDIDSRVNRAAMGSWDSGEYFPKPMADRWRTANAAHKNKMDRFHTGPQQSMFRQGGDGLPSAQGAELAGKFFNAARSQADDAKAFKRLIGDNPPVLASLKNYAITDLAGQTDKFGRLNNLKYNNWVAGRDGALRETFDQGERSLIGQIGREVKAADLGATTGMARGSNTLQNAANALQLGVLDNKLVTGMAHRIPVVGRVTGPMLDGLRESARRGKAAQLDELLADPVKLDAAIQRYLDAIEPGRIGIKTRGLLGAAAPAAYRVGPLLGTGQ